MFVKKVNGETFSFKCSGFRRGVGQCNLERDVLLSTLEIQATELLQAVKIPTCPRCGGDTYMMAVTVRDLPRDHVHRVLFKRVFDLGRFTDDKGVSETNATKVVAALDEFYNQEGQSEKKADYESSSTSVEGR